MEQGKLTRYSPVNRKTAGTSLKNAGITRFKVLRRSGTVGKTRKRICARLRVFSASAVHEHSAGGETNQYRALREENLRTSWISSCCGLKIADKE